MQVVGWTRKCKPALWWPGGLLLCLLAGCASERPAPVASINNKKSKIVYHSPDRKVLTASKYRVKKGDTLYSIAFQAGADYRTLASINKIAAPYTIFEGQWLALKAGASAAVKTAKATTKSTQSAAKTKKSEVSKKWRKQVATPKKGAYSKNVTAKERSSEPKEQGGAKQVAKQVSKWIWPSSGRVIATYSAAAQGNKGIDIAGHRGDDVLASADGKVVYAGNALRGYGNLIIVKHSDNYLSAYAHNDQLFVTEKQWVKVGQRIASIGSSGTTSPRLHFEIRYRGKSVNPLKYLPKRAR